MKAGHKHLSTLDSLRGFAALSVCLFHYSGKVLPKVHVPALETAFGWGWAGVEVFFVISGFIIPYVLIVGDYRIKDFGSFIGKRFVRICPPSYIVILLTLGQWWLFDHVLNAKGTYLANLSFPQVVSNFLYIAPFLKYDWINGVFWTLSVEFQYYILLGLVFRGAFRNVTGFTVFAALVAALYYLPVPQEAFFFKYGALFMMGGIASMYYTQRASLTAFLVLTGLLSLISYFQTGAISTGFGLATTLIIVFVHFRNAIGAFLGKISYSLYLIHIVAAPVFEVGFVKLLAPASFAGKALVQILCVLMSVLCAYLYYLFVERYFIRLANRLFAKKSAAQPSVRPDAVPLAP